MTTKRIHKLILAVAAIGIAFQQSGIAWAAEIAAPAKKPAPSVVGDIKLASDGKIHGQVVDRQGIGKAGARITVTSRDGVVQRLVTAKDGRFRAAAPKGGVYAVSVGASTVAVRVWTQQAAPPTATRGILLVADDELAARGQLFNNGNLLGLGVTAAIVGVVIAETVDRHSE